jgi:hypothetical protein
MTAMEPFLVALFLLLLLDLAAARWGYDSRDGFHPTLRRH